MTRSNHFVLAIGMLVLLGVILLISYLDDRYNARREREATSRWYECTLPDGTTAKANWIHVDRRGSRWMLSGEQSLQGAGNLTCRDIGPTRPNTQQLPSR